VVDVVGDGVVEYFQGVADLTRSRWLVGRHHRPQQPVVDLAVEHREALPVLGEHVGVGVLEPHDQPFQPQPGQVVAAAGLAVGLAEQPFDLRSEGSVGEAADQVGGDGEGAGQGLDPRVAEPQGWGPPPVHQGRSRDPLKGWTRKDAALTDMFMIQQSAVHVTGLRLQLWQMHQAAFHPEVGGVVDHGLDSEGAAFL